MSKKPTIKTANEKQLRKMQVPTLNTIEELSTYINGLVNRPHDYGTCIYAMSMAAVAAYNHVAKKLGITGFQAGCADINILQRNRQLEHGFMIIDFSKFLYPQYNVYAELKEAEDGRKKYFKKIARKFLHENTYACEEIKDHWKKLANQK